MRARADGMTTAATFATDIKQHDAAYTSRLA